MRRTFFAGKQKFSNVNTYTDCMLWLKLQVEIRFESMKISNRVVTAVGNLKKSHFKERFKITK